MKFPVLFTFLGIAISFGLGWGLKPNPPASAGLPPALDQDKKASTVSVSDRSNPSQ